MASESPAVVYATNDAFYTPDNTEWRPIRIVLGELLPEQYGIVLKEIGSSGVADGSAFPLLVDDNIGFSCNERDRVCNIAPKVSGVWPEHWEVHVRFSKQLDFTEFVRSVMEGKSQLAERRLALQERLKVLELEQFPLVRLRSATPDVLAERGVQTVGHNDSDIKGVERPQDTSDGDDDTAIGGGSTVSAQGAPISGFFPVTRPIKFI
ncbi:hypothetical protein C8Q73DRAFT_665006 [Cubamyces lactineus]|nr:hypothetical protein C8Q73DRAFT_665006 [Cubamyces lactineus]